MSALFERRLSELTNPDQHSLLASIQRGLEKESLRITPNGHLAQTPHPADLGSALCHPSITTDYSEALLEFITPVDPDIDSSLKTLDRSEERRVGKACRSRWSLDSEKKTKTI